MAWVSTITDIEADRARIRRKIPHWVSQIQEHCPEHSPKAIRWIQDAIMAAEEKDDLVSYAAKMLGIYAGQGESFVVKAPEPDLSLPAPAAPSTNGYRHAHEPRLSPSEERQRKLSATFKNLFKNREYTDGPR
jgi:hypothetical protein